MNAHSCIKVTIILQNHFIQFTVLRDDGLIRP